MAGAGSSGDDWPYYFLNSLSPNAGPTPANPLSSSTTADDLSLPVDSADLQRQLEAWTNITFDFDDDAAPAGTPPPTAEEKKKREESALAAAAAAAAGDKEKEGKKMAGMMSTSTVDQGSMAGYHFESLFGANQGVANAGDASPYDPRRGVGTGHHHMHHLFPGPQEHAFRLPHSAAQHPHPHLAGAVHAQHGPIVSSATASPHLGAFSLPPLLQSSGSPAPLEQQQTPSQQQVVNNFTAAPITFSSLLTSSDGLSSLLRDQQAVLAQHAAAVSGGGRSAAHKSGPFAGLPEIRPYVTTSGTPASFSDLIGGAAVSVPMTASSSLNQPVQTPTIEEPEPFANANAKAGPNSSGSSGPKRLSRRASTIRSAAGIIAAEDDVKKHLNGSFGNDDRTPSDGSPAPAASNAGDKLGGLEDDEANRLAIEEDKRRRNTAASGPSPPLLSLTGLGTLTPGLRCTARFRIKKKLREQAIERTAQELRDRVTELEKEVESLQKENGCPSSLPTSFHATVADPSCRASRSDRRTSLDGRWWPSGARGSKHPGPQRRRGTVEQASKARRLTLPDSPSPSHRRFRFHRLSWVKGKGE